ncbi:MAG: adenylate kinase [Lachnospiraceae bacterium]|nr:adenylate kinase [Lachnospiraceae bacterium]
MKIVMLGAPGAGKGTMASRLSAHYNIPHISTGDIFRENIKNQTELGKKAKAFMDEGALVPDELTCDLVADRIRKADCKEGFILDGFPRTIPQAEALTKELSKTDEKVDHVINLEISDEDIVERMSGRRSCPKCKRIYHTVTPSLKPKTDGICDDDGETLVQREDDKPEVVLKRLSVYHEQTEPLVDYYRNLGVLDSVSGKNAIDEEFDLITKILDK